MFQIGIKFLVFDFFFLLFAVRLLLKPEGSNKLSQWTGNLSRGSSSRHVTDANNFFFFFGCKQIEFRSRPSSYQYNTQPNNDEAHMRSERAADFKSLLNLVLVR